MALHLKSHGSTACLDARAANVTANVQLRARAAVVGAACGTLLREAERGKDIQITAGADHCDVTMPRTHHGIFIEGFKKKNKALQMSEGHRVLRNLYPTASANSRTCNTEIPPTAKAPLKRPDLQWLADDTGKINKFSHACHRASLLMRAKSPKERVLNTYLSSGLIPNGPAVRFRGSNVQTHTLNTTATSEPKKKKVVSFFFLSFKY